jgi:citrate lyase beta subunit
MDSRLSYRVPGYLGNTVSVIDLAQRISLCHTRLNEARAKVYFMEKAVEALASALAAGDRAAVDSICREILEPETLNEEA